MGSILLVRRGGAPGAANTDFTSYAPDFSSPSSTDAYIKMGMRFANGEASQGGFLIRDLVAAIPKADFTLNLPAKSVVLWTENSSGTTYWLSRGRIMSGESGRGVPRGGDPVEFDIVVDDANVDLRGLAFTSNWVRPAETDYDRLVALQSFVLNGSPRPSTVITVDSAHLAPNTNTVSMPAKTYEAGSQPTDVIDDCATTAGKVYGVVIHHSGGSHLCLQYIIETDNSTYASTVKISDHIADVAESATPPVYAPRWLAGRATSFAGEQQLSTIVNRWGPDTASVATYSDATTVTSYDYWAERFDDSDSVNATQAANRAVAEVTYRKFTHVTHRVSVAVPADKTNLLAAGMSLQIKAAAALGGQYLNTYQTRRIAQLIWEPRNDGYYWAHMELDRSLKRAPYSNGKAAPASTVPKPTTPGTGSTELVNWTWSEPGPGYPAGFGAYQQSVVAYASISQSAFTMNNGLNNSSANYRSGVAGNYLPVNGGSKYLPCTVGTPITFACDIGNRGSSTGNGQLKIRWRTGATGTDVATDTLWDADLAPGTPTHVTATLTPPATATVWAIFIIGRIDNVVASTGGATPTGTLPPAQAGSNSAYYSLIDHNHDHGNLLDLNQPSDHPFFTEHRDFLNLHLPTPIGGSNTHLISDGTDLLWSSNTTSGGSLTDHDHTTSGDGGDLTAAVVSNYLKLTEQTSVPATPSAGTVVLYGSNLNLYQKDSGGLVTRLSGATSSGLTVKDEGTPLATDATSLDFTGAGVTATGTGAAKTVTIPGASGTSAWDVTVIKGSDQDVTNSTTLTDDTALQFTVAAGEIWYGELYIIYAADSIACDYKFDATMSANNMGGWKAVEFQFTTADAQGTVVGPHAGIGAADDLGTGSWGAVSVGTPAAMNLQRLIKIWFFHRFTGAGTFKYRFAQVNATAAKSARTCAGSLLQAKKLA